jgi:D-alanyl-lipoteichoic acid acyltransferase DltB (MBOAT superfamily)
MLFNSIEFILFLPITFLLYWFVFKQLRLQNLFIVIASYVFYGWWDCTFLILIAFTTLCSYLSGIGIEYARKVNKCKLGEAVREVDDFGRLDM